MDVAYFLVTFMLGFVKMLVVAPIVFTLLFVGAALIVIAFWLPLLVFVLWVIAVTPLLSTLRRVLSATVVLLLAGLWPPLLLAIAALLSLIFAVARPFVDTGSALADGEVTVAWHHTCTDYGNENKFSSKTRDWVVKRHPACAGTFDVVLDVAFVYRILLQGHCMIFEGLGKLSDPYSADSEDEDDYDDESEAAELVEQVSEDDVMEGHQPKDIASCLDLACGILFACLGLAVGGGICTILLVLKSPVLFIAALCHYVYYCVLFIMDQECMAALASILFCLVGFVFLPIAIVFAILLSLFAKLAISAFWPAYVAAGWLWVIRRRQRTECFAVCTPCMEGFKAIYQVIWIADLITNSVICMHWVAISAAVEDIGEIAQGQRTTLRPVSRLVSWLPAVRIGIFSGAWEFTEADIVRAGLGKEFSVASVNRIWSSFFDQCKERGQDAIDDDLLKRDACESAEPFVILGLPGLVILRAVERSPCGEAVIELADGTRIDEASRPKGGDMDSVWESLMVTKVMLETAGLSDEEHDALEAMVLVGGEDSSQLSETGKELLALRDKWPADRSSTISSVAAHVNRVAIAVSKLPTFQARFQSVLEELSQPSTGCYCCLCPTR